jgi:hypothetical protein
LSDSRYPYVLMVPLEYPCCSHQLVPSEEVSLFISTGRTSESMTSMLVRCVSRNGHSMAPDSTRPLVRLPPRCLCRCDARRPALAAAKVKSSSKGRHGTAQRQLALQWRYAQVHVHERERRADQQVDGAARRHRVASALHWRGLSGCHRLSLSAALGRIIAHTHTNTHAHAPPVALSRLVEAAQSRTPILRGML